MCRYVKTTITTIPEANPTNLPGHSSPSKPVTTYLEAYMRMYEIGQPKAAII